MKKIKQFSEWKKRARQQLKLEEAKFFIAEKSL